MKPRTKMFWQVAASIAAPVLLLLLPLRIGIWLPDVFIDRVYVLAEAHAVDGTRFRVEQFWNHADFYTTTLYVTHRDGAVTEHLLDGDDNKSWSVPLVLDEQRRVVTVFLGGNRAAERAWDNRTPSYTPPSPRP